MNATPLLVIGAAGVALLLLSQNKSKSADATDPNPDAACKSALDRVRSAAMAGAKAASELAKNPNDPKLQAALKTAQQAGQATVAMWPKSCGPMPAFDPQGNVLAQTGDRAPGGLGGHAPLPGVQQSAQCDPKAFEALVTRANTAGSIAQASPGNQAAASAANQAWGQVKQAADNWWKIGCPPNDLVKQALAALAQFNPNAPTGPTGNRFNDPTLFTPTPRPATVARLAPGDDLLHHGTRNQGVGAKQITDRSGAVLWQGPFCEPDVQFGDHGIWPIASVGFADRALGPCPRGPVTNTADRGAVLGAFAQWAQTLSDITNPSIQMSAGMLSSLNSQLLSAETVLATQAPSALLRYLAFLYALFGDVLPELTKEDEKAIANHVILITDRAIRALGGDPQFIPELPAVWIPRDGSGALAIPMWSPLNLYPGLA